MRRDRRDDIRRAGGPDTLGPTEHAAQKIQAALDDELSPQETERVRAHCSQCPACDRLRRETESVHRALAADPSIPWPDSFWPLLRERLPRRFSRRARLSLALGASAAAVAGLAAGVLFGSLGGSTQASAPQATWTEVGSQVADGSSSSLDEVYLSVASDEGGESR